MHGARLTRTPGRNWPRGRRFRQYRMGIDGLVGTGSSGPSRPLRTHSPSRLTPRRRGRHHRRPAGDGYLVGAGSARDGCGRTCYSAFHRKNHWPRPGRQQAPAGGRGCQIGNPSCDQGAGGGDTADQGGRGRSGPLGRVLHDGYGLRCGRGSNRSSGSRGNNGRLGRRGRDHHGLARCRLDVRNRTGQRLEVRTEVVQLLKVQPCRQVWRFDSGRR